MRYYCQFILSHFGIRSPNGSASNSINTDMNRELQYNTAEIAAIVIRGVLILTK